MKDRELLELAYKAATGGALLWDDKDILKHWNPLTHDGDALRLAVKLGMSLTLPHARSVFTGVGEPPNAILERINNDPYAATRRAIVRAAAEIGKSL